jgi:hypothetical protein
MFEVTLTSDEELRGFQRLCRKVDKPQGSTVEQCIATLKEMLYVNIVDLINARRIEKDSRSCFSGIGKASKIIRIFLVSALISSMRKTTIS